jgi:hypothetical protein
LSKPKLIKSYRAEEEELKQKRMDKRRLKMDGYDNRTVFYNKIRSVGRIGI